MRADWHERLAVAEAGEAGSAAKTADTRARAEREAVRGKRRTRDATDSGVEEGATIFLIYFIGGTGLSRFTRVLPVPPAWRASVL